MRDNIDRWRERAQSLPTAIVFICVMVTSNVAAADLRPESRHAQSWPAQDIADGPSRRDLRPESRFEAPSPFGRLPFPAWQPRHLHQSHRLDDRETTPFRVQESSAYAPPGFPPPLFANAEASPYLGSAIIEQAVPAQRPQGEGWLLWDLLGPESGRDLRIESHVPNDEPMWNWSSLAFWQVPETLPPLSSDAASRVPGSGDGLESADAIGERPQDNSMQFLRSNTVLLRPGQWQFDYGLTYTLSENEFPIAVTDNAGTVTGVVRGRVRQRLLVSPFQVRYGLRERAQLFLDIPVGWAGTELSFAGFDEFSNVAGIGDMQLGTSLLLRRACGENGTDLVGTVAMTFPTGNAAFPVLGLSPQSQLGDGYFALSLNLLWIKTIDPLVLFYGGGYRHRFDNEFLGNMVDPGEQFSCQFGVGFAVNDRITLSAAFLGAFVTENQINGDRIEGSILEPSRFRFSATIAKDSHIQHWRGEKCVKMILEPFAEIGMTDDAPAARVGVVWTL